MVAIFVPLDITQSGPLPSRTPLQIEGPTCRMHPVAVNKAKKRKRLKGRLKAIQRADSSISSPSFGAALLV